MARLRNRPSYSRTAERRAHEAMAKPVAVDVPPAPPKRTKPGAKHAVKPASPNDGLTRRERRIKRILLKELDRLQYRSGHSGLTYAERQNLEKRLDVAFIDAELAKMRRALRIAEVATAVLLPVGLIALLVGVVSLLTSGFAADLYFNLFTAPLYGLLPYVSMRAVRRRIFIYEALRELSGADEEGPDVALGHAVEEADALIQQIIDREMELDARYPLRTRA